MYCSHCRQFIDDAEAAFCPECGRRLVPAPFAEELPPTGPEQGMDATSVPWQQPGPGAETYQNGQATPVTGTGPANIPAQQTGTGYGHGSPSSDTETFAVTNQNVGMVNSIELLASESAAVTPPPRTRASRPKGRGKAGRTPQQGKGAPIALIVALVIALVLVAGLVFLWFYFDLKISDITEIFSKKQDSANSSVLYHEDTAADKRDDLLTNRDTLSGGAAVPVPTPVPIPTQPPRAEATDSTVVLRNAHPNGRLLVDGVETPFEYVGDDIVIQRAALPDICQIRFVAENGGAYEMAAIWYNSRSENDLSLTEGYGDYVPCDASGLGKPSTRFINVLLWAYHEGFLRAINEQSTSYLRYSTAKNTYAENEHVFSTANARNTYDLDNFSAECDENSVTYSNDGKITLNATFVSYATNRTNGNRAEVVSRKTMELIWEDGVWKVNRLAFVNDSDYAARRYADLP